MVKINNKRLFVSNLSVFDLSTKDYNKLLNFTNNLREFNKDSSFYSDKTWKKWKEDYFIGFSNNKVFINSGFIFPSNKKIIEPQSNDKSFKKFFSYLKYLIKKRNILIANDQKKLEKIFHEIYKKKYTEYLDPKFNNIYEKIKFDYPLQYYLALEMIILMNETKDERINYNNILEIGPGGGILALILFLNNNCSLFLIDIPEVLIITYLNLKIFLDGYDIFFPNEIEFKKNLEKRKIYLLTPSDLNKLPKNYFDLAINTSSFQEIDIKIVNYYLDICNSLLIKDGEFHSNNQTQPKHIKDNSVDKYDLSKFNCLVKKNAFMASKMSNLLNYGDHTYLNLKNKKIIGVDSSHSEGMARLESAAPTEAYSLTKIDNS